MARTSTYLNFPRRTEEAFEYMFWGGYFASFTDRFGIHWMINCATPA